MEKLGEPTKRKVFRIACNDNKYNPKLCQFLLPHLWHCRHGLHQISKLVVGGLVTCQAAAEGEQVYNGILFFSSFKLFGG